MKTIISILFLFYFVSPIVAEAAPAITTLRGKILLQVEDSGKAWYVKTDTGKRVYIKDGQAAYDLMRASGVGIKNIDLQKIPIGLESRMSYADSDYDGLPDKIEQAIGTDANNPDSDGDSYKDGTEVINGYDPLGKDKLIFNTTLVNRLKGKIVLQVENHGEAWYINPANGKRYYMADGPSAYQVMKYLSLGISNKDLAKIDIEIIDNPVLPNDTNANLGLSTYTIKDGTFNFQYPSTIWKVYDTDYKYILTKISLFPIDIKKINDGGDGDPSAISINFDPLSVGECITLDECSKMIKNDKVSAIQKYIKIDGDNALYVTGKDSVGKTNVIVFYIKNDRFYTFSFYAKDDNEYEKYLPDFNRILSSFKNL